MNKRSMAFPEIPLEFDLFRASDDSLGILVDEPTRLRHWKIPRGNPRLFLTPLRGQPIRHEDHGVIGNFPAHQGDAMKLLIPKHKPLETFPLAHDPTKHKVIIPPDIINRYASIALVLENADHKTVMGTMTVNLICAQLIGSSYAVMNLRLPRLSGFPERMVLQVEVTTEYRLTHSELEAVRKWAMQKQRSMMDPILFGSYLRSNKIEDLAGKYLS